MLLGEDVCCRVGYRIDFPAELFAEPEFDWTFLEVFEKKCLYNEFYSDFESFRKAIEDCIADAEKEYAEELKTLMTLKFQSFENVQFLAV